MFDNYYIIHISSLDSKICIKGYADSRRSKGEPQADTHLAETGRESRVNEAEMIYFSQQCSQSKIPYRIGRSPSLPA